MGRLAVILGSSALGPGGEQIAVAAAEHGAAIVQRHAAADAYVLPHQIDHEANLRPLAEQGVDRVLAISSVGSLKPELPVGTLVCPTTSSPCTSTTRSTTTPAPTRRRASTRGCARK